MTNLSKLKIVVVKTVHATIQIWASHKWVEEYQKIF